MAKPRQRSEPGSRPSSASTGATTAAPAWARGAGLDVWNFAATLMTRTVDQTVATLRKKIESDPDQPQFLQTVYGVGYRLVL